MPKIYSEQSGREQSDELIRSHNYNNFYSMICRLATGKKQIIVHSDSKHRARRKGYIPPMLLSNVFFNGIEGKKGPRRYNSCRSNLDRPTGLTLFFF